MLPKAFQNRPNDLTGAPKVTPGAPKVTTKRSKKGIFEIKETKKCLFVLAHRAGARGEEPQEPTCREQTFVVKFTLGRVPLS